MRTTVYVIVGCTYPYKPECWSTKLAATKRMHQMRRRLREQFPGLHHSPLTVEPRRYRDMIGVTIHTTFPLIGDIL